MNKYSRSSIYIFLFLLSFGIISAQVPDKFTNLTVLPKEITKKNLVDVMRSFSSSLGVRCNFCHAGKEGINDPKSLSEIDFASDKIPAKDIARVMMKMTGYINNDQLPLIKEKGHIHKVRCVTCHKGMEHPPEPLQEILYEEYESGGVEAAMKKYAELREKYYGGYAYDFTFNPLSSFSEDLIEANKSSDLIKFLKEYKDKYDSDSWNAYLEIGKAYESEMKYDEAEMNYNKALEISPDNGNVMWYYKKLKEKMNK